jgi:hypothetical protein
MPGTAYALEAGSGELYAFYVRALELDMDGWFVFLPALAGFVHRTAPSISSVLRDNEAIGIGSYVRNASRKSLGSEVWLNVLATYASYKARLSGQRKPRGATANLTLYPMAIAVRIVNHYADKSKKDCVDEPPNKNQKPSVDTAAQEVVNAFWAKIRPPAPAEERKDSDVQIPRDDTENKQESINDELRGIVKRELEPVSYLQFQTTMEGSRVFIDLTQINDDEFDEAAHALQSHLSDNFLASVPPASVDTPLKRMYRLADKNISTTLKFQMIQFGEWRTALWNWSRDDAHVSATTFDGNISNLLLFAGYCTAHAPLARRISPLAFDLSVIFGSQTVLEPLVVGYLKWLRSVRRVMYSTIQGYLNSLVVMANYYFADEGNSSFDAGSNCLAVKTGLRRVRSQAHSAAQHEGTHKAVHPHWISWRGAQHARRRAANAYFRRRDGEEDDPDQNGSEGAELRDLYANLEDKRRRGTATINDAMTILRHPLYKSLQELVAIYLHSCTPPVRVAITRCLEFKSTFVKLRADPSRYVVDLKNNSNSPSAMHKTAKHYRHAILPMPCIERITELIDSLRGFKLTELKRAKRYVFVNSKGEPFSQTSWCAFIKRAWADWARAPSESEASPEPPRQPNPSLCRTMFVTW